MTAAEFRAARERLGLSQSKLADALGISQAQVSRIEKGDREASRTVIKLLELQGCIITHIDPPIRQKKNPVVCD